MQILRNWLSKNLTITNFFVKSSEKTTKYYKLNYTYLTKKEENLTRNNTSAIIAIRNKSVTNLIKMHKTKQKRNTM